MGKECPRNSCCLTLAEAPRAHQTGRTLGAVGPTYGRGEAGPQAAHRGMAAWLRTQSLRAPRRQRGWMRWTRLSHVVKTTPATTSRSWNGLRQPGPMQRMALMPLPVRRPPRSRPGAHGHNPSLRAPHRGFVQCDPLLREPTDENSVPSVDRFGRPDALGRRSRAGRGDRQGGRRCAHPARAVAQGGGRVGARCRSRASTAPAPS